MSRQRRRRHRRRQTTQFHIKAAQVYNPIPEYYDGPVEISGGALRDIRLTRVDGGRVRAVQYGDSYQPKFV